MMQPTVTVESIIDDIWIDIICFCHPSEIFNVKQTCCNLHQLLSGTRSNARLTHFWRQRAAILYNPVTPDHDINANYDNYNYSTQQWCLLFQQLERVYLRNDNDYDYHVTPATEVSLSTLATDAAKFGYMLLFQTLWPRLLKSGQDVSIRTLATTAGKFHHSNIVKYCLSFDKHNDNQLRINDEISRTAYSAVLKGDFKAAEIFIESGAHFERHIGYGELKGFVRQYRLETLEIFLQCLLVRFTSKPTVSTCIGVNWKPHKIDKMYQQIHDDRYNGFIDRPLWTAICMNNIEAIHLLIEYGAKIDVKYKYLARLDEYNDNVFSRAAKAGMDGVVRCIFDCLTKSKPDVIYSYINRRNRNGYTPYILACKYFRTYSKATVETLVNYCKVDLTICGNGTKRGSDYIDEKEYWKFKQWLIEQENASAAIVRSAQS